MLCCGVGGRGSTDTLDYYCRDNRVNENRFNDVTAIN